MIQHTTHYTHTHKHTNIHAHLYKNIHTHIHTSTHAHTHMHACTHVHMYTMHTQTCTPGVRHSIEFSCLHLSVRGECFSQLLLHQVHITLVVLLTWVHPQVRHMVTMVTTHTHTHTRTHIHTHTHTHTLHAMRAYEQTLQTMLTEIYCKTNS